MSFLSNRMMFSVVLFKKYFGSKVDPMKNAANAMINVTTRLFDGAVIDRSRNNANRNSTISGWKRYSFSIMFLFKKLRKFSSGYNFLKKLSTHWPSINSRTEKINVNRRDLWNSSLILLIAVVNVEYIALMDYTT